MAPFQKHTFLLFILPNLEHILTENVWGEPCILHAASHRVERLTLRILQD